MLWDYCAIASIVMVHASLPTVFSNTIIDVTVPRGLLLTRMTVRRQFMGIASFYAVDRRNTKLPQILEYLYLQMC